MRRVTRTALAVGLVLSTALAASGCAHQLTVAQRAEQVEIGAETLFQATAASLDALQAGGVIDKAAHDADEVRAWNALQDIRLQYRLGKAIDTAVLAAVASTAHVPAATIQQTTNGS